jgi:hypothetical protein
VPLHPSVAGAEEWEQQDGLAFDDALTKYVGDFGKGQVRDYTGPTPQQAAVCTVPWPRTAMRSACCLIHSGLEQ